MTAQPQTSPPEAQTDVEYGVHFWARQMATHTVWRCTTLTAACGRLLDIRRHRDADAYLVYRQPGHRWAPLKGGRQ
ncbi:hypothetical protein [Actinomadura sp. GTD37]|uniref:hypothetical protein n=1 Tax=Actinomadura sp. GTD37 TaxID=1778030 RepID=UPI0035C211C1